MAAREDCLGLFWEDAERVRGRGQRAALFSGPMPEVPRTGWKRPEGFPELRNEGCLCIDLETYDPDLRTRGPGWARGRGHVLGVAVGTRSWRGYYPIGHEIGKEDNFDKEQVIDWLNEQLSNPHQAKLGANIIYDLGWLREIGVKVNGPVYDVQYAEALLNEIGNTDLEFMSQKYLGEGKKNDAVSEWLRTWSGLSKNDMREYLYKAPPCLVGPYGEGDVTLPLQMMPILWGALEREGLTDLFAMECALIPLFLEMRAAGVTIDIERAEEVKAQLEEIEIGHQLEVNRIAGIEVNINAAASIGEALEKLSLPFGLTEKGHPRTDKASLQEINHPITQAILEARKVNKARKTFVESYLLDSHVKGKLYGQFHALRGNDGGTRSGRCASSTPNLQNIPSRDEFIGPLIRSLFIPDCGHRCWRRFDYSQIEYRFLAHFAEGPGAETLRDKYRRDTDTDYHVFTQQLIREITGQELGRKPTKTVNFGLVYGMSEYKLRLQLGLSKSEAEKLFSAYHQALPYVLHTMGRAKEEAQRTGRTRTLLGRVSRFDFWVPMGREGKRSAPLPYAAACATYGPYIERAHGHKALNRKLQGSAADFLKLGMLKCWQGGIFAETGVPRLTVHDELDFSDPGVDESVWHEMQREMENASELRVPVKMDSEKGESWGTCR